jgi:EAL domain-containing protein (putative c-di-GMP-specific phosphodiesterase class I)
VSVAVNVSAVQFRREGFCELIRQVLLETGLAPQYLELEVTESLLLSSADVTLSVLQELKNMGLSLAIDDFGTGPAGLVVTKTGRDPAGIGCATISGGEVYLGPIDKKD